MWAWPHTGPTVAPLMTRWKELPLKCRGFPILPTPFSPVINKRSQRLRRDRAQAWLGMAKVHDIHQEVGDLRLSRGRAFPMAMYHVLCDAYITACTVTQTMHKQKSPPACGSPVQRARKFSAVFGTTSALSCVSRSAPYRADVRNELHRGIGAGNRLSIAPSSQYGRGACRLHRRRKRRHRLSNSMSGE